MKIGDKFVWEKDGRKMILMIVSVPISPQPHCILVALSSSEIGKSLGTGCHVDSITNISESEFRLMCKSTAGFDYFNSITPYIRQIKINQGYPEA